MKRIALLLTLLSVGIQAFPQCTPDNSLTLVGLYPPDSLLPCVEEGEYFDEVIQFKNFTAISGDAIGFPGFVFTINWVRIDSVSNLPAGLSYTCNDPNCQYFTGEVGCVNITGTTNAAPGDYSLGFYATIELDLNGTPFQANADSALLAQNGLGYTLTVIANGDSCPNDLYVPPACFPDPFLTEVGFYPPDTLLECVESGTYYDVIIQFKNFDTVQGGAIGFPGFTLPIISVQLDSVTNTPDGLTYTCNNDECFFLGGETGCVRISGFTNAAPGVYNLGFYATVVADLGGSPFTFNADSATLAAAGLGYRLTVIQAGTVCPNTFIPGPLSVDAGSPPVVCDGDPVTLSASINGGAGPYTFAWSPGTFLSNSTLPNPVLSPSHPGTYSVTVTDNNGATATDAVVIQYSAVPSASVSDDATICPGASTQISAAGGQSYTWTPATGLNDPNIFNPTASPAATTTYTVEVSNGSCSDFGSVTVSVNESAPAASFTFIKNNFNVAFVNNTTNGGTYFWDFGDGQTSTQTSPNHQYTQQQVFTVTMIATNACGLKDTTTGIVDMSVGIAALAGDDVLSVYPNPGNGMYQISFKNPGTASMDIEVVTLHGESIYKENAAVHTEVFSLDLFNQPKGIYFLKVQQQDLLVVKKVVIQ